MTTEIDGYAKFNLQFSARRHSLEGLLLMRGPSRRIHEVHLGFDIFGVQAVHELECLGG